MYLCFQCATCTGTCTSAQASDFRVRKLVRLAQLGLRSRILSGQLEWMCNTCYRCYERCPRGVDIPAIVIALRNLALKKGYVPEAVTLAEKAIIGSKNVFAIDHSLRRDWADYTGAEVEVKKKADTVYFVGCITSYSGRVQGIAQAISSILNNVEEDWTLLEDEWCCGHPLALSGGADRIRKNVEHNVKAIEAKRAKRVVTGCPGCYLELKNEYPKHLGRPLKFQVLHFTELLDEHIEKGSVKVPKLNGRVTYHDPCELGRIGGIFDEPRRIIKSFVPDLVEPRENLRDSTCCGAGGFVKGTNLSLSSDLADLRMEILLNTGARTCLSACPSCHQNLMEAAVRKGDSVQVLDIAELVAQQLGLL